MVKRPGPLLLFLSLLAGCAGYVAVEGPSQPVYYDSWAAAPEPSYGYWGGAQGGREQAAYSQRGYVSRGGSTGRGGRVTVVPGGRR